jgi:hypothetical protein
VHRDDFNYVCIRRQSGSWNAMSAWCASWRTRTTLSLTCLTCYTVFLYLITQKYHHYQWHPVVMYKYYK